MDVQTVPFQHSHLPAAAELVCQRYRRLRQDVPDLPQRYEEVDEILPRLAGLLQKSPAKSGFALLREGALAGFLLGLEIPDFMGRRASLQPRMGQCRPAG